MADHRVAILAGGRFPLVVRVPCLLFGLFCLLVAVEMVVQRFFGAGFLLMRGPAQDPPGAGTFIAVVAFLLVLAFGFTNLWFFDRRVWLVPDRHLLFEFDWLGGTLRRTVPLDEIASIEVKPLPGWRSDSWGVKVRLINGNLWHLQEAGEEEAGELASKVSWMIGVPQEYA